MKFVFDRTRWRFNHNAHRARRLRFTAYYSVLLFAIFVSLPLTSYGAVSGASEDAKLNGQPESSAEIKISATPIVDVSPEFRQSLTRQFEHIRSLEEEGDAFSEGLGEAYMGYGKLLAQAGRLEEARDMYARSLHLAKVNHGIYAIEQRPVLRSMFEMHDVQRNIEKMEVALNQIRWLEQKNLELNDNYSYDLVLRMGEAFVELYHSNPKYNEISQARVRKALRYYSIAIDNYDEVALSERQPPYGELAVLYFLSSRISKEISQAQIDHLRDKDFFNRNHKPVVKIPSSNFLGLGSNRLFSYLDKAEQEENVEHQVMALRDLGDLYLLFGRQVNAANFYRKSWLMSNELDENHALVLSFSEPVRLPAFNYVSGREPVDSKREVVIIPLSFSLNNKGRVRKIYTKEAQLEYPKLLHRARRAARNMVFRPAIEFGEMIHTESINRDVPVVLRRGESITQQRGVK